MTASVVGQDGPNNQPMAFVAPLHISKFRPLPVSTSSSFSSFASTSTTSISYSTTSSVCTEPEPDPTYKSTSSFAYSLSPTSSFQNFDPDSPTLISHTEPVHDEDGEPYPSRNGPLGSDFGSDESDHIGSDMELKATNFPNFLRVFHSFTPSSPVSSTGAESSVTVAISAGDLILVHSIHPNGWADGTLLPSGARGWLPTNYCEPYDHNAISTLLEALLQLWDLISSIEESGLSAFTRDDYVRAMIAGVRVLLEKTDCLNRDSNLVVEHVGVKTARKALLGDLTSFVRFSKQVRQSVESELRGDALASMLDSLVLHAAKVVTGAVTFLDIWGGDYDEPFELHTAQEEPDSGDISRSQSPTSPNPTLQPIPRAFSSGNSFPEPGSPDDSSRVKTRRFRANKPISLHLNLSDNSDLRSLTKMPPNATPATPGSFNPSSATAALLPLSDARARSRISMAHSTSSAGVAQGEMLPRASQRLAVRHDAFLGCLGSFIGGHMQSRSPGELVTATEQSVAAGRLLISVVEEISNRDGRSVNPLEQACELLDSRLVELVQAAKHLFTLAFEEDTVLMPDHGRRLVTAATGCVRAAGEAVGKARSIVERLGDFELETPSQMPTPSVSHPSLSDTLSDAQSPVSSSDKPLPRPPSTRPPTQGSTLKPLPELPPTSLDGIPTRWRPDPSHPSLGSRKPSGLPISVTTPTTTTQTTTLVMPVPAPLAASPISRSTPLSLDSEKTSGENGAYSHGSVDANHVSEPSGAHADVKALHLTQPSAGLGLQQSVVAVSRALTVEPPCVETNANGELQKNKSSIRTYAHDLVFHKNGYIVGGSLPALVERLTTHESTPENLFVSTFFLTFRLFTTPVDFAKALIDRFEYIGGSRNIGLPVILRVYNVFKGWLECHWQHSTDKSALPVIHAFASGPLSPVLPSAARRLCEMSVLFGQYDGDESTSLAPRFGPNLRRNLSAGSFLSSSGSATGNSNSGGSVFGSGSERSLPNPTLTRHQLSTLRSIHNKEALSSTFNVLDVDPLEMARQLTLMASRLLCSIDSSELLGSAWVKKDGRAPNVKAMASFSNNLNAFITDLILQPEEARRRAAVIRYWIKVAQRCQDLDNYDSLIQIVCALSSSVILRLSRTWDLVPSRSVNKLNEMKKLFDITRNHATMRKRIQDRVPPCIPFLGMFLTDLTFIDAGNADFRHPNRRSGEDKKEQSLVGGEGASPGALDSPEKVDSPLDSSPPLINFGKHVQTARVIQQLLVFQEPYRLTPVPELQSLLEELITSNDPAAFERSAQGRHLRSLQLEPREQNQQQSHHHNKAQQVGPVQTGGGNAAGNQTGLSPGVDTAGGASGAVTPASAPSRAFEFLGISLASAFSGGSDRQ